MKKMIIIDDNANYLKSLELVTRRMYEPILVQNYHQAIEELEKQKIDLALIDIRLDEKDETNLDGLKILEWIKMNKPDISCFVMSAYTEFSYAETALNLGAKHFFRKPIDIASLLAIIKEKG